MERLLHRLPGEEESLGELRKHLLEVIRIGVREVKVIVVVGGGGGLLMVVGGG